MRCNIRFVGVCVLLLFSLLRARTGKEVCRTSPRGSKCGCKRMVGLIIGSFFFFFPTCFYACKLPARGIPATMLQMFYDVHVLPLLLLVAAIIMV